MSVYVCSTEQGYIRDEKACHSLAFAVGRARIIPQPREVCGERHDSGALLVIESCAIGLTLLLVAFLGLGERAQCLVPLSFERVRNQSAVGIDLHKAPTR